MVETVDVRESQPSGAQLGAVELGGVAKQQLDQSRYELGGAVLSRSRQTYLQSVQIGERDRAQGFMPNRRFDVAGIDAQVVENSFFFAALYRTLVLRELGEQFGDGDRIRLGVLRLERVDLGVEFVRRPLRRRAVRHHAL